MTIIGCDYCRILQGSCVVARPLLMARGKAKHMTLWIFLTWIWVPSGWGPVPLSKSVMGPYPTAAVCEAARGEILNVADDDWRVYVGQCRKRE